MLAAEGSLLEFRRLEQLAEGASPLHRLDARAKILVTLMFLVVVVSTDRHTPSSLFPFFIFPAVMAAAGGLPVRYLLLRILAVIPFILLLGIFNPLLERQTIALIGPLAVSAGWLSFTSIVLRALLTLSAALILISLTGFPALCRGLQQLGLPGIFTAQLLFLYRYLFVLAEEASRLKLARSQRSFGKRGLGFNSFGPIVGHLLLRSWERAERIYQAMLSRGFDGTFQIKSVGRFGVAEVFFLAGWSLLLIAIRLLDPAQMLGSMIAGAFA